MYRILKTFISILFINTVLFGQTAIDFTETDVNGVEHNLYDYLDAGKTVVLDVFTSNCGPCWTLHQNKTLEYLHDILGPEAMNEVVVLSYEVDPNSDNNNLLGLEEGTYGDFITDTPYPVFNPSQISPEFEDVFVDGGYPTLNVICPETKQIVSTNNDNYYGLLQSINSCGTLPEFSDLVTVGYLGPKEVCSSFNPAFSVLNGGTQFVSPLKLNLLKDGVVVHQEASWNSIGGGVLKHIQFYEYELTEDASIFTVEIASEDDNPNNNTFSTTLTKTKPLGKEVTLYIDTEFHFVPLQNTVTWIIKDSDDNIVYQGDVEIDSSYEIDLNLEEQECYSFTIEGSHNTTLFEKIELIDKNQNRVELNNYQSSNYIVNFNTDFGTKLVDLNSKTNFNVFPSPVVDILSLKMDVPYQGDIQIQINQLNGAQVFLQTTNSNGANEINLDVSSYESGIYFIQLSTKSGSSNMKFVKM